MTSDDIQARLLEAAILPILTINDVESSLERVGVLVGAGVQAIEIVLRTPAARDSILAVRSAFPDLLVAAGTVVSPALIELAIDAGAHLAITPGLPPHLIEAYRGCPLPVVPGVLSPTEVLSAVHAGYRLLKYYPAVASNGSVVLEDYINLFPGTQFIPTGKIGFDTLAAFAGLKNVTCIGGSWMHSGPLEGVGEKVSRSLSIVRSARQGRV